MTQQEMDLFATAVNDFLAEKFPELAPGGYNLGVVSWHLSKKDKERQKAELNLTIERLERLGYEVIKKPPVVGANTHIITVHTTTSVPYQYGANTRGKEC